MAARIAIGAVVAACYVSGHSGCVSAKDTANHLVGGILMGFGGAPAISCAIGQGITSISTWAAGSVVTLGGIVAGSWTTMKYQYWRPERADRSALV